MTDIRIRLYHDSDVDHVAQLFFDAVHTGTADVYDAAQRRAWGGDAPNPDRWRDRLAPLTTFVAEGQGRLLGFMSIDATGLIDLAFVAPDSAGSGIGWRLYRHVETRARHDRLTTLRTDASHKARPFFERQGWSVIEQQTVTVRGVELVNFRMRKDL